VLEKASQVDIRVYDAAGNQIAVIADQQETPPGIYNSQTWDGRNYRGTPVANGVYFGRMKIGKATTGFKIAVIR
jgi:flagellar hook assembly protein FlgD